MQPLPEGLSCRRPLRAAWVVAAMVAVGCGGGPAPTAAPEPPAVAPAAPEPSSGAATLVGVAEGARDPFEIVNEQRAVTVRVQGSLRVGGQSWGVDLTLARSGAMRMRLDGPSAFLAVSDGATLSVQGPAGERRESALRPPVPGNDPVAALSPFDLVEVLLPAPLPSVDNDQLLVVASDTGSGTEIEWLCADCDEPEPRRAVTVDTAGQRVVRREHFGPGGVLELRIEWPEAGVARWQRVPDGEWIELRIDAETAVDAVAPGTFHVGVPGAGR